MANNPTIVDRKGKAIYQLAATYRNGVDLISEAAAMLGLDSLVLLWDDIRPNEVTARINWPDAFNKFGFDSGDFLVPVNGEDVLATDEVAAYLESLDFQVFILENKNYNPVIAQLIHSALGDLVPLRAQIGHSNPREWLPPWVQDHLNARYGLGKWNY